MSNSKIYAPLVLVMGMLMFLLNYCTKIVLCSLVFTLLMYIVNTISKTFGFKRALITISAYVGINILFLSDFTYVVNNQVFAYLIPTSLLAVLFSSIASMKIVSLFENRIGFAKSTFVALVSAAIIDGIAMSAYFMNYLSTSKIAMILLKEVSFKCLYATALLVMIKVLSNVYNRHLFGKIQYVTEKN